LRDRGPREAPGCLFWVPPMSGQPGEPLALVGLLRGDSAPDLRGVQADRLLLEYDDERSGDFEPLRYVPEDKTVVLGLVTTKTGRIRETPEELEARIREAARYVPLERLAVSPQCGFSTSVMGNEISPKDEEYKLRTLVQTAAKVWG
ncbi:MAG: methionine synthase, partial [Actinomycetota bacterium]|nr:methionine synthase [Actinomycetota bacterium]